MPPATSPKIRSDFYRILAEKRLEDPALMFDEAFGAVLDPLSGLRDGFSVEVEDDVWFVEEQHSEATTDAARALQQQYFQRRHHYKGSNRAIHDALLLRWVAARRERRENAWIVTLDTSLPSATLPHQQDSRSFAITLTALLQWISPLAGQDDGNFAAVFADLVRNQVLPRETFFDLGDFLVFAGMEWDSKELPAPDVEGCIRHLRVVAPNVDPTTAEGRESLAREVAKYFADPSRKFKEELQRAESRVAEERERAEHEAEALRKAHQAALDLLAKTHAGENERRDRERVEDNHKRDSERDDLLRRLADLESDRDNRDEADRRRAATRFAFALCFGWAFVEAAIVYIAVQFGTQTDSVYQRLLDAWPFLTAGIAAGFIAVPLLLGESRRTALGWRFKRFFNSND